MTRADRIEQLEAALKKCALFSPCEAFTLAVVATDDNGADYLITVCKRLNEQAAVFDDLGLTACVQNIRQGLVVIEQMIPTKRLERLAAGAAGKH